MVLCSWDEAGPCAQGSPFLGLADAGETQPKAFMSFYLKDIPSLHFLPKGSPHTPGPMEAPSLHSRSDTPAVSLGFGHQLY